MGKPRILIAGGCSFTQYPQANTNNWPYYLSRDCNFSTFYLGTGSSDNSLIAHKVMNQLSIIIKSQQYRKEDLLVGVMWSGMSRHSVYLQKEPYSYTRLPRPEGDPNHLKSNQFVGNPNRTSELANYYLVNAWMTDELSQLYYKHFYDDVGAALSTLKNMLLVQNFCKLNNIPYFFTEYNYDTISNLDIRNHIDVKYLYDCLDFDHFLPVDNMGNWCRESGLPYLKKDDDHPTSEMSEKFTQTVIVPYLKSKGYV